MITKRHLDNKRFDYQQSLQFIWVQNLKNTDSNVLCISCGNGQAAANTTIAIVAKREQQD